MPLCSWWLSVLSAYATLFPCLYSSVVLSARMSDQHIYLTSGLLSHIDLFLSHFSLTSTITFTSTAPTSVPSHSMSNPTLRIPRGAQYLIQKYFLSHALSLLQWVIKSLRRWLGSTDNKRSLNTFDLVLCLLDLRHFHLNFLHGVTRHLR